MAWYAKLKNSTQIITSCTISSKEVVKSNAVNCGYDETEFDMLEATIDEINDLVSSHNISLKTYADKRREEYPDIYDYIDGVVKDDQEQINKYIADCQAVKNKFPKENT